MLSQRGPLPEGDAPVGLYWGMTLAATATTGSLAISVKMWGWSVWNVAPWLVLLLASTIILAIRHRRWDRLQQKRRLTALQALVDLASVAGAEADTEEDVLQRLPEMVRAMFGMAYSYACVLEDEGTVLRIIASRGPVPPSRMNVNDLPMTRRCIAEQKVIVVPDTKYCDIPFNAKLSEDLNQRSLLAIPMVAGGTTMGVLILADLRPRYFTELDLTRAALWGRQAAIILANCRLYAQTNQALEEQRQIMRNRDQLYEVNTAIHRPGTLEEVLQRIADLAPGVLGLEEALVWLKVEDDPNMMVVAAATLPKCAAAVGLRVPIAGSLSEAAWKTGEVQKVDDTSTEPKMNPRVHSLIGSGSLLFEPLLDLKGKPLGILTLGRVASGPFEPAQLQLAHLFAHRAAAAVENGAVVSADPRRRGRQRHALARAEPSREKQPCGNCDLAFNPSAALAAGGAGLARPRGGSNSRDGPGA